MLVGENYFSSCSAAGFVDGEATLILIFKKIPSVSSKSQSNPPRVQYRGIKERRCWKENSCLNSYTLATTAKSPQFKQNITFSHSYVLKAEHGKISQIQNSPAAPSEVQINPSEAEGQSVKVLASNEVRKGGWTLALSGLPLGLRESPNGVLLMPSVRKSHKCFE